MFAHAPGSSAAKRRCASGKGRSRRGRGETPAGLSGSLKVKDNRSVEPKKERFMPDFKQLAEGEKPADPDRHILIEVIHEPAIGKQYKVTGHGLGSGS